MYREQQQQQQQQQRAPHHQRFKKPFDNRHQHQNARHYSKMPRNNAANIRNDDFHHNHAVFQENFQHKSNNCIGNANNVAQHRQPLIANNQLLLPDLQSNNNNNNMQQTVDESIYSHQINYIHRDSMQNFQTQRHHNIPIGPHSTEANMRAEENNNNNNNTENNNMPHSKGSLDHVSSDFSQINSCSTRAATNHQQFEDQHHQQFDSSNYFQTNACSQRLQQNQPDHETH
ncbi:MAG: hypothetical protein MHMPM18_002286, partial [Marteilia pararefringens]